MKQCNASAGLCSLKVKTLKQALKGIPAAVDKNERFKRVSAVVGGNHSKKDCYEKYRELKAEAKLKQATSRAASGVSLGSGSSRDRHTPAQKRTSSDGPACSPPIAQPDAAKQEDIPERASTTAESVAASAGSSQLSRRGSTFSSWSSNSAEYVGQLHRRSTTSSTLSSVQSDPSEDIMVGGGKMVRETAHGEGELMQVEEVDVEDFCLDDELLAEEQHSTAGRGQTRNRGPRGWEPLKTTQRYIDNTGRQRNNQGSFSSVPADGDHDPEWRRGTAAVTEAEANGVRDLVMGNASESFNDAWREQGFYFCGIDGLRYGLVQAEGGPCGVLAAVQAFLLEVYTTNGCRPSKILQVIACNSARAIVGPCSNNPQDALESRTLIVLSVVCCTNHGAHFFYFVKPVIVVFVWRGYIRTVWEIFLPAKLPLVRTHTCISPLPCLSGFDIW